MAIGLPAAQLRWVAGLDPTSVARNDADGWFQRALAVDSTSSAKRVIRLAVSQLSAAEREAIHDLTHDHEPRTDADRDPLSPLMWSVMAKPDQHVVSQTGILYRVIRVGDVLIPVGGLSRVTTLAEVRGRGHARAVLESAAAFVGMWLWAPFALVLCAADATTFYEHLGWRKINEPISYNGPGDQQVLTGRVALVLACQGEAE